MAYCTSSGSLSQRSLSPLNAAPALNSLQGGATLVFKKATAHVDLQRPRLFYTPTTINPLRLSLFY